MMKFATFSCHPFTLFYRFQLRWQFSVGEWCQFCLYQLEHRHASEQAGSGRLWQHIYRYVDFTSNSVQWHQRLTQWSQLIIVQVFALVNLSTQSRISVGVCKYCDSHLKIGTFGNSIWGNDAIWSVCSLECRFLIYTGYSFLKLIIFLLISGDVFFLGGVMAKWDVMNCYNLQPFICKIQLGKL